MSLNKTVLIGRLTADPVLRYTKENTAVATFTLAVNRPRQKDKEQETDFIDIIIWRKQAENAKKYLNQGSQVAIDGRIQTRNYEDKDGKKVYVTEVVADNVQYLDTKKKETKEDEKNPYDFQEQESRSEMIDRQVRDFADEISIDDDDLPF